MLPLLDGLGERVSVLHGWVDDLSCLVHVTDLLRAPSNTWFYGSLGHFVRDWIQQATLHTHEQSCDMRMRQLGLMGNTHSSVQAHSKILAHLCIFAGSRKVWAIAACFLLNTLLRASFIFLFVLSVFTGLSFTLQLCKHNLVPSGERCPMLCIPLGSETSLGCLPPCPALPYPDPCRCICTAVLGTSAQNQQEAGENSIKIRQLNRKDSLWSKGWGILPVCHWGYLLHCHWMNGAQSVLQSSCEGAHNLMLCHGSML